MVVEVNVPLFTKFHSSKHQQKQEWEWTMLSTPWCEKSEKIKKKMGMAKSLNTTAVRECARSYRAHHTIFVVWHKPAETWPKWILDILTWSFGQLKNRIPKKIQRTIAVLWIRTAPLFSCGIEKKPDLQRVFATS